MFLLFLAIVFVLSVIATGVARDYALANGVMDMPNDRSSHTEPTPRGGGLAIIVVPGLRLAIHLLVAFAAVAYFGVPQVPLGALMIDFGWIGYPLAAVALAWCLNFFNFMDGIDGIAAVESVTMAIGAWLVLAVAMPEHGLLPYLWLLAVASGGFLVWNWAPARVFMGDAASSFLGLLFALFVLITSGGGAGEVSVWCWLILFGVFFTDATITLFLRVIAREPLQHAHRRHAYQRFARILQRAEEGVLSPRCARANAHRAVSLATGVINLLWLTPLALAAALLPEWGLLFALVALAPLVLAVLKAKKVASVYRL